MIIKYIKKYVRLRAIQEDFRKTGLTFTTAGIVGIFLQHLVKPHLAIWLAILGLIIWMCGLLKINMR